MYGVWHTLPFSKEKTTMKPEQWIIDDMRAMRSIKERTYEQQAYLDLLQWYCSVLNGKA